MRRRLLTSTLAAVAAAVVLLGVPLGLVVRGMLVQQAFDELEQLAENARVVLDQATARELQLVLQLLAERSDSRLMLLSVGGQVLVDTDGAPPGAIATGPDVARAVEGRVGRARGQDLLTVAVPVEHVGEALIVRATSDDDRLRRRVRRAWLLIAWLALSALGAAALLARWQGRRLAAPLEDLAVSARRLGEGDFSARAPRSGLPEADEVAGALDRTADRLAAMLERSQSFNADASHQLRTPLTALRLDLEALEALEGAVAAEGALPLVAAAMAEADRLETTIEELLTLTAAPAGTEHLDLRGLVSQRLDAWQALAGAQGRAVVVRDGLAPPVRARAAAIGQCLQVLLDNALEHGQGTITVAVEAVMGAAGRDRPGARLCVSDEGPGFPDDPFDTPDGRAGQGLMLARSLVEAEGGRLHLERTGPGARVCLLLPAHTGEG